MKKVILLTSALILLGSTSANAEINLNVDFGEPVYAQPVYMSPGYVIRPDYPSEHYDRHRHRHNDYWARRNQEERGQREHASHDNGNHREGGHGNEDHGRK